MLSIGDCFIQFFVGLLFGIIDEWNKKVMFFIMVILVIGLIILGMTQGTNEVFSGTWLDMLIRIVICIFGFSSGKFTYKKIFEVK